MNEEGMNNAPGGEANAQNAPENEQELQQSAPDAGVPSGEAGGGTDGAGGAAGTAAGEGTAGEKPENPADAALAAPGNEADAAPESKNGRDDAKAAEEAAARAASATARLAEALLSEALRDAGVPRERAGYAARMMDVSGIDPLADDAAQKYAAAAQKLVADIPEFVPAAGGTGSAGEHPRHTPKPEDETAAAFRRGMGR